MGSKVKQTIIQIAPYFPPHAGGLENVVREISTQLVKDGYAVEVVTARLPAQACHGVSGNVVSGPCADFIGPNLSALEGHFNAVIEI